jgi:hypothetical protein
VEGRGCYEPSSQRRAERLCNVLALRLADSSGHTGQRPYRLSLWCALPFPHLSSPHRPHLLSSLLGAEHPTVSQERADYFLATQRSHPRHAQTQTRTHGSPPWTTQPHLLARLPRSASAARTVLCFATGQSQSCLVVDPDSSVSGCASSLLNSLLSVISTTPPYVSCPVRIVSCTGLGVHCIWHLVSSASFPSS